MINILKPCVFLILITLSTIEVTAQRGVTIGYIDMEYILENVPEYQEALTQLDGRVIRWKKDIEDKQKEIDNLKRDLTNEKVLLTRELVEEREEDIKIKEDELFQYQQDRFGPQGDLIIQKRQLVQPVQNQVYTAIQEIAGNRKYDFIFDKSADVVMLYAAERNDISDQVIRMINRAAKRQQAENKQDKRAIEERDAVSDEQDKMLNEREQALADRKAEREALIAERTRIRDSVRAAKLADFEKRREEARNRNNPNRENQVDTTQTGDNIATPPQKSREEILAERRRVQDSIRNARIAEQEARRQKILEERQRRQDSIRNARNNNNPPSGNEEEGDGFN